MKKIMLIVIILIIAGFLAWWRLEKTEELNPRISREEALVIAQKTEDCSDAGVLTDKIYYNGITKTWWIDLERTPELEKDGCSPACVVWEETETAEVNWRCTGLLFDSGATGKVLLGPTCPVMKDPPDPACADKPYQTTVQVIKIGSPESSPFATAETDKEGVYKVMLPPGEYGLQAVGGNPFPSCETKNIIIEPDTMQEVNLSCDTGIR